MAYRRPNPAADKAAANQAVIKSLLKLPGNKVCADCKRNKLPRWASWNLGIFICIRCSGLHRGMGTHISRVKSVDLDSWTDEQLASMVKWGNTRANKYWEANLAPGHVPAESKIENFVRTKYESKRWVLSKEIPDPATLGDEEGDDELPLKVVQNRLQQQQAPPQAQRQQLSPPRPSRSAPPAEVDLIGGDDPAPSRNVQRVAAPIERPSSAAAAPAPKAAPSASSELFGEFFGSPASTPAANPTTTTTSSRPDLNRSILSLYATIPKQPPQPQVQQQQQQSSAFGDLAGDFGGLSFAPTTQTTSPPQSFAQPVAKPSPFDSLAASAYSSARAGASKVQSSNAGFFSSNYGGKPPQASKPAASQPNLLSSATTTSAYTKPASTGFDDLLGLSASPPAPKPVPTTTNTASAFNLSAWSNPAPPTNTTSSILPTTTTAPAIADPWADFASPAAAPAPAPVPPYQQPAYQQAPKPVPTVAKDDDWGSFSSAVGPTSPQGQAKPAVPLAGANKAMEDDLFGNVWG